MPRRYNHDCGICKFLNYFENYDLYVCSYDGKTIDTLVARYGDKTNKYVSGLYFATEIKHLKLEKITHDRWALIQALMLALKQGYQLPGIAMENNIVEKKLKIWEISRKNFNYREDNGYISGIVVAETEEQARNIHPSGLFKTEEDYKTRNWFFDWVKPENVIVRELGGLTDFSFKCGDVIASNFNMCHPTGYEDI